MITTTTVTNEIKARVNDEINRCLAIARAKWPNLSFDFPHIEYRQMGRKAGYAEYRKNKISLNCDFFNNGHAEDMITQTGPHELAHLVTDKVYGGGQGVKLQFTGYGFRRQRLGPSAHGYEWKSVMRLFGLNPDRCHNYSLEGVKVKGGRDYEYTCKCGGTFHLSITLHRRIQMGQRRWCKKCKGTIYLKGTAGPTERPVAPVNIPVITMENFESFLVPPPPMPIKTGILVDDIFKKVPMPEKVFANSEDIQVPRDWE